MIKFMLLAQAGSIYRDLKIDTCTIRAHQDKIFKYSQVQIKTELHKTLKSCILFCESIDASTYEYDDTRRGFGGGKPCYCYPSADLDFDNKKVYKYGWSAGNIYCPGKF